MDSFHATTPSCAPQRSIVVDLRHRWGIRLHKSPGLDGAEKTRRPSKRGEVQKVASFFDQPRAAAYDFSMRLLARAVLLGLTVASSPVVARAQPVGESAAPPVGDPAAPPATQAGPLSVPPTVGRVGPSLAPALDGRRDIRGCAVGQDCLRPQDKLREFELAMFGKAAGNAQSPWLADDSAPAMLQAQVATVYRRPSDYRAELGWMDSLELPDLPVRWTPRLIEYLLFYKNDPRGRNIMEGWLVAQGRYRELILQHLRAAKLPSDLLYVAMIESSYDPFDSSYAGASGLWQFMPEGARIYGLHQDRWVDERRDPLRSTIAVVDYWKDLYQRFGDWHVAMAAFNAGYGALLRSIARYNTNDYWQLCEYENGLPWETSLYVPKALAVAIVGHNRAVFGFDKIKEATGESWQTAAVPASISLSVVAKAAATTVERVKQLNPQLRRNRTPPGVANYVLRVPVGTAADFARRLADLQSDWDGYDAYMAHAGERFEDIATLFGISTKRLRELNEITHESEVAGGTVLVVPRISPEQREKNRSKAKQALHASGPDQRVGEPLLVAVPDKNLQIPGRKRVFYRVVTGDSLLAIAGALGVRATELATWNGLSVDAKIHPKMIVQAFVAKEFVAAPESLTLLDDALLFVVTRGSAEHLDIAEERVGRVRLEYRPSSRETFAQIGKRYGLTEYDMARINRKSAKTVVEPGEAVVVYQVVARDRSPRAEAQSRAAPRPRHSKTVVAANGVTGKEGQAAIAAVSEVVERQAAESAESTSNRTARAKADSQGNASDDSDSRVKNGSKGNAADGNAARDEGNRQGNATSGNAARGKDGSKGNGKGNAADGNAPRDRDKIDNRSHSHKDGSTNDVRDAGGGKVNPSRASRVASEDAVAPETGPVTSPSAM